MRSAQPQSTLGQPEAREASDPACILERSSGTSQPVTHIPDSPLEQAHGSYASRPRPRPSMHRQHASHSLVGHPMTYASAEGQSAQHGNDRSSSPGNSPWYKPRSRSRLATTGQGPTTRSFDVHGRFSPPSPISETSCAHPPLADETSSLLQKGSPDLLVFNPEENANWAMRSKSEGTCGNGDGSGMGLTDSGGIPDGHAAHGGHSMKGVRTLAKGQHARMLPQQRASDAQAGSFNFKRTIQELSAGISNSSKSSSSQNRRSRTPCARMPEWMELLRDSH